MATPAPTPRHPLLVCTVGHLEGERFAVTERGLTLGRSEDCDIRLDDQGVSREHARVLLHNDAVWVQDAGSRNGCFVNGRRLVRHKQLAPGDELKVGEHCFTVELVDPFPEHESISTFGALPDALAPTSGAPASGNSLGTPAMVMALSFVIFVLGLGVLAAFFLFG